MPLSLEKQVAVTLYYLADERRMRKVANAFGIGKSTGERCHHDNRKSSRNGHALPGIARVNDLFQFWAISVHAKPKCFSCRHEKWFGIV